MLVHEGSAIDVTALVQAIRDFTNWDDSISLHERALQIPWLYCFTGNDYIPTFFGLTRKRLCSLFFSSISLFTTAFKGSFIRRNAEGGKLEIEDNAGL